MCEADAGDLLRVVLQRAEGHYAGVLEASLLPLRWRYEDILRLDCRQKKILMGIERLPVRRENFDAESAEFNAEFRGVEMVS